MFPLEASFVSLLGLTVMASTQVVYATNTTLPSPTIMDLGSGVVGALQKPGNVNYSSEAIAVLVMHAEQDYLTFSACTELASRGFTTLCANNDASKSGFMTDLDFERMMQDVALGVSYLRNQSEFSHIVLLGHSGGGAMMSAYQNIAENGLDACQGEEKLYPCTNALSSLPEADGIILLDANYGLATMTLLSLNPAILDESSGMKINASLDLYSTANGLTETGANYSSEFTLAFQSGVVARMNRLINYAETRLQAINAGNASFSDDEELYIPDAIYTGNNNKFFAQDIRFLSHTTQSWPLLHSNESSTTQIVQSVRVASNFHSVASSYLDGAIKTTIKRFLSALAIKVNDDFAYAEDGLEGIDWTSSHMVPIGAVPGITVPLLTLGMTGHWEYLNAEKIYLSSGSDDKTIAFVEGAQHTIETCTECESYPGEFGDTTKTTYDYVAGWLAQSGRFME